MGLWSYTQGVKAAASSGTPSITITGVTAGHLLVCGISAQSSVSSVSDGSNTWNLLTSGVLASFYTVVTTGGSLTITSASNTFWALGVAEFNPGGGAIAKAGGATPALASGNSQTPLSSNYTVTTPCLGVGFFRTSSANGNTWSTNGNWIEDPNSSTNYLNTTNYGFGLSYWLSASSSPIASTISLASIAAWNAEVAGFTSTGGTSFQPWIYGDQIQEQYG